MKYVFEFGIFAIGFLRGERTKKKVVREIFFSSCRRYCCEQISG